MVAFLNAKKIRSKKVLALFQKKKDLFLETVKDGIWMPIPSINSGQYVIKVEGYDVLEGKYLLTVTGYARKEIVVDRAVNYVFQFKITKVDGFTEAKNPQEEIYEFNIGWLHTTRQAVVHWLPKKESGVKWPLDKEEYGKSIVIPLDNDEIAYLTMKFDVIDQTVEDTTNCRVKTGFKTPKDFVLESDKEYPIYEEIYKRRKTSYKELGRITID